MGNCCCASGTEQLSSRRGNLGGRRPGRREALLLVVAWHEFRHSANRTANCTQQPPTIEEGQGMRLNERYIGGGGRALERLRGDSEEACGFISTVCSSSRTP